jgi:4-amino-4-deoxy-L-arabinose transferase-like glycosyltransferase
MSAVAAPPQPVRTLAIPTAPPDRRWLVRGFLALWCSALFFYGVHAGQLWKTEGLRAIVAAEMLRSGNWLVPRLYGEPLFTKPPGMYVAIALCSLPFGEVREWTARLPSAVAALLTVLMLYGYFARCFGRGGGLTAAIVIPMAPLWLDKASAAEIDMMQVMWVTAAMVCFLRALEGEECVGVERGAWSVERGTYLFEPATLDAPRSTMLWWLAALLCVAGGVLTKWTAPAFFYAAVVPLLWWRGRLHLLWGRHHLTAAATGAAVCFAWVAAAIALEGWDVFVSTVRREALQRMVPDYAPNTDPWYAFVLHPLVLLANTLPWSAVALWACRPSFARLWDERGKRLWQALHCWAWPNVLIWSLMLDHKARHSFPLFPAFGGLAAMVWIAWLTGRLPWKLRVQPKRALAAALACWLAVKVVYVEVAVPRRANRDPAGKAAMLAALVPSAAVLYLFQVKDEGIMFYYARPVQRLSGPDHLPSSAEPLYCILANSEWERWQGPPAEVLARMSDEQGAPMVLVRIQPLAA